MAYVAISRVRTLAGLHLLAFDPKSIKVSDECVQEVNRLRKLFRPDLTSIPLSKECKAVQHKISALPLVHTTDPVVQHPKRASVKHSAGTKKQKTVDNYRCQTYTNDLQPDLCKQLEWKEGR